MLAAAAADDIRRFRQTALTAQEDDVLHRILDFGDFYTLSNCRDLLFHAHEQHVTIAAIRSLLTVAELRFIGFETIVSRFRSMTTDTTRTVRGARCPKSATVTLSEASLACGSAGVASGRSDSKSAASRISKPGSAK